MGEDLPVDPISDLASQAAQTHELYAAYVNAGFTEPQAMQLVCTILSTSLTGDD